MEINDASNFKYHPLRDFIKNSMGDILGSLCFCFLCYVAVMLAYVFE